MTDLVERANEAMSGVSEGPWQQGEALDGAVFNWHLPPDHPRAMICYDALPGDAYFIAESRQLVPALAAEVARLTALLREAEEVVRSASLFVSPSAASKAASFLASLQEPRHE